MKKCATCKILLDESKFSLNPRKKDGLNSNCKECHSEYRKQHYLSNKEKYIKKAKINNQKSVDAFVEFMKDKKCVDCGNDNPIVLEFDHREDKLANVSTLVRGSLKKLHEEIAKCDIVCSNCHKIRTAKQLNWTKSR